MITLSDIYIKYGDRILLDRINLTIKEKERIGLVGRNGAGKSTLLKIIADDVNPHSGSVDRPNNVTIGFLHQELNLPTGKTVLNETMTAFEEAKKLEARIEELGVIITNATEYESDEYMDNIQELSDASERFALLGGTTMEADAQRILAGLGFKPMDMDRQTEEFSGGWKMRIELAKMLLQRPDYLLLDEPTNHLDIESIIWLEQFLQTYEGVVITISHDKMFLDNVTKRTVEVELGNVYDYKAPYTKYMELRAERKEKQASAANNQQKVIAAKQRTINRFMAKANKTKMAQSMQKQLDKMERIEIADEDISVMKILFPPAPRSGRVMVDVNKVVKNYGDVHVLDKVDFRLERGERVAFVGQNGQGKTTLSKILLGIEKISGGDLERGHNIEVGYYAQNQADTLDANHTVLETMEKKAPEHMRTRVRAILGAFMFSGEDSDKKVKVLSGGERARLALACMLLEPFNLLVLDEPTNHLDMLSKEVLKNAILKYDGSLIVVSHDREFLTGLTEKTIEFRDKKLYEHLGDVNYFLERRALNDMRDAEKATVKKRQEKAKVQDQQGPSLDRNAQKKFEKQIKNIERKISNTETEIKKLEVKMAEEGFYNTPEANDELAQYNKHKESLDKLMEEWETVASKLS